MPSKTSFERIDEEKRSSLNEEKKERYCMRHYVCAFIKHTLPIPSCYAKAVEYDMLRNNICRINEVAIYHRIVWLCTVFNLSTKDIFAA